MSPRLRRTVASGQNGRARELVPDERLWEIEERYRGSFAVEPLSFGTGRDLADSRDRLAGLARASDDMKDLQRCWMVKAVLGSVDRGGRLVEIGAGEPLVADLLSRLGYEVTVVDPYDGSGHGPVEFERFRATYPDVSFIRERFPPSGGAPEADCVYSISVLEHIPVDAVGTVMDAALGSLAPGGCTIHAVDHVVAGWGAEAHLERLEEIVGRLGFSVEDLHRLLDRLREDPEAYFVSAEAHERWRGALPYERYPMRRIASIGVLGRAR
ncbi:MAG TPA: methyltransferase domain-containing protein [Solirubrobacterales bacterium]|nr:methyltransferase domain-containing protein [Solirubrobacterales bacterium]